MNIIHKISLALASLAVAGSAMAATYTDVTPAEWVFSNQSEGTLSEFCTRYGVSSAPYTNLSEFSWSENTTKACAVMLNNQQAAYAIKTDSEGDKYLELSGNGGYGTYYFLPALEKAENIRVTIIWRISGVDSSSNYAFNAHYISKLTLDNSSSLARTDVLTTLTNNFWLDNNGYYVCQFESSDFVGIGIDDRQVFNMSGATINIKEIKFETITLEDGEELSSEILSCWESEFTGGNEEEQNWPTQNIFDFSQYEVGDLSSLWTKYETYTTPHVTSLEKASTLYNEATDERYDYGFAYLYNNLTATFNTYITTNDDLEEGYKVLRFGSSSTGFGGMILAPEKSVIQESGYTKFTMVFRAVLTNEEKDNEGGNSTTAKPSFGWVYNDGSDVVNLTELDYNISDFRGDEWHKVEMTYPAEYAMIQFRFAQMLWADELEIAQLKFEHLDEGEATDAAITAQGDKYDVGLFDLTEYSFTFDNTYAEWNGVTLYLAEEESYEMEADDDNTYTLTLKHEPLAEDAQIWFAGTYGDGESDTVETSEKAAYESDVTYTYYPEGVHLVGTMNEWAPFADFKRAGSETQVSFNIPFEDTDESFSFKFYYGGYLWSTENGGEISITDDNIALVPTKYTFEDDVTSGLRYKAAYSADEESNDLTDKAMTLSHPENYSSYTVYFTTPSDSDSSNATASVEYDQATGIESILSGDSQAPAVYYDLRGIRVDNPANGLYIKVEGGKAAKVTL